MKHVLLTTTLAAAALSSGCVSTSSVGYGDGVVTTSPVPCAYEALPVLQQPHGTSYRVTGDAGDRAIAAFEQRGMQRTAGAADVEVAIELGAVQQSEPGAVKVGGGYVPAFTVTVPYRVTMQYGDRTVAQRADKYDNLLTFKSGAKFATEEQAKGAIDAVRTLAGQGLEQRSREAAAAAALQSAEEAAALLFERREVTVEVPVVRSAAGVDMEPCYQLIADGQDPAAALHAYEQLGTEHRNQDGTVNATAGYGVLCGVAAARLLLGDLAGAWAATREADRFEPDGQEADKLRLLIYRQEQHTGVAVIPDADRRQLQQAEAQARTLQQLFAAPNR